jgi:hypothetical protein
MADELWMIDVDLNDDDWHFGYYSQAYGATTPREGAYNRWDAGGANPVLTKYADAPLPVGLASFSASQRGGRVVLAWITESEVDNGGFILERSMDGTTWTAIASYRTNDALKGRGTSSGRTEYAFTDEGVRPGGEYRYRLSDESMAGVSRVYAPVSIRIDALPRKAEMEQAYPNPFNPQTFIAYRLAEDTNVNITVFDMLGRQVQTLFNGRQPAGSHRVFWLATDETGNKAPGGGYLIQMKTEKTRQIQKVLYLK